MYDQTVRMCTFPAWICISTETGMNHCNGRFIIQALKIFKKGAKLSNQKHTFVYNGPAAHRYYISIVIGLFKLPADNIQFSVKIKTLLHIIWFFNKCLHDIGHTLTRFVSKYIRHSGHCTPSKEFQTFFYHNDLKHFLCLGTLDFLLREKELSNSVLSFPSNLNALFFTGFFEKFMRNLQKDSHTISGFSFCILSCTMIQIFYNTQGICNRFMAFFTFNIYNCTNSAVIMLKFRAVKTLLVICHFSHISSSFLYGLSFNFFFSVYRCLYKSTEQRMRMIWP